MLGLEGDLVEMAAASAMQPERHMYRTPTTSSSGGSFDGSPGPSVTGRRLPHAPIEAGEQSFLTVDKRTAFVGECIQVKFDIKSACEPQDWIGLYLCGEFRTLSSSISCVPAPSLSRFFPSAEHLQYKSTLYLCCGLR